MSVVSPSAAQCLVTAHVPDGQIVAAGGMVLKPGPATTRFAITGGAGAYGAVRGTVVSHDVSQTKSLVTLRTICRDIDEIPALPPHDVFL